MIEVRGLVAMMVAIEGMTTTAAVECVMLRRVSGGYLVAAVLGDLASVEAALEVGRSAAEQYDDVRRIRVHPAPHPAATRLLTESNGWLASRGSGDGAQADLSRDEGTSDV